MPPSLDDQTLALSEPVPPSSFGRVLEQPLGEVITTTPAQAQHVHDDTGPGDLASLDTVLRAFQGLRREVREDQRHYAQRLDILERCVSMNQEQCDSWVAERTAVKDRLEQLESEHANWYASGWGRGGSSNESPFAAARQCASRQQGSWATNPTGNHLRGHIWNGQWRCSSIDTCSG